MKRSHLLMSVLSLLLTGVAFEAAAAGSAVSSAMPDAGMTIAQTEEAKDGVCDKGKEATDPDCK